MNQLYLHIGTPKTGTTSIQNFCRDNTDMLHSLGYDYPDMPYRYSRASHLRNAHFLAGYLHDEDGKRDYGQEENRVQEAFAYLRERFEQYNRIILSDEGIWNRSLKEDCLLWKRIQKELKKGDIAIKVIVYLRPQYDYMYSWWNQRIKAGMWSESRLTWEEMLQKSHVLALDYYDVLEHIAGFVGKENIVVRMFDRSQFLEGSLYRDFQQIVGLPRRNDYYISDELHNTSLNRNNSEIKRILNGLPDLDTQTNVWFRDLLKALSGYMPDEVNYSMFNREQMREFTQRFRESNEKVSKEYLGKTSDLFYKDYEDVHQWTPEKKELTEAVVCFFGELALQLRQENRALEKQLYELENIVKKQEKQINAVRNLYKHPIAAVGNKMKSVTGRK